MLGKLYKNEIKSTGKLLLPLFGILILLSTLNRFFTFNQRSYDNRLENFERVFAPELLRNLLSMIGIFFTMFFMLIVFILLIRRFSNHMFGDQGYLTNTLPVSSWEHVLVKSTVSAAWMILAFLAVFFSVIFMIGDIASWAEIWENIVLMFRDLSDATGYSVVSHVLHLIFGIIILAPCSFLSIYCAISMGQLWRKHRKLGAFLAFFLIYLATSIINSLLFSPLISSLSKSYNYSTANTYYARVMYGFMILSCLVSVVIGGICFFLTTMHLNKHLNLE